MSRAPQVGLASRQAAYRRQQKAKAIRRKQLIAELRAKAAADPGYIWEGLLEGLGEQP